MKKNILLSIVFAMLLFTGVASAKVQFFGALPPEQPHPLGQALGQGLAKSSQRQRDQQQARILSRVLSGKASQEEMAQLDPTIQLEVAKIMQLNSQNGR